MSGLLDICRLLIASLLLIPTSASPIPQTGAPDIISRQSDAPPLVQSRGRVSAANFTDWPTNIVMLGGAQQFGTWIEPNSGWDNMCNVTCLDLPAYALGACCSPTIHAIGVAAGTGTCDFVGISGWTATISDDVGNYTPVGPPQTIVSVKCYSTGS
ncbi:hypothetical protein DV735_g3533, partial [Chaetothyriales sp. CBS 134920]